jgi:hypothetical protein
MKLTELVEDLYNRGIELEDADPNPHVVVYVWVDGLPVIREIDVVATEGGGRVVLHCSKA